VTQIIEKNLLKNPETKPIGIEKSSSILCQQCSNLWRDKCLVTKPKLVSSITPGLKNVHTISKKKTKPKSNKW